MNTIRFAATAMVTAMVGFAAGWWLSADMPAAGSGARGDQDDEILYWVAPMDPAFRSDRPGKSPMGMDLVPVYANAQPTAAGERALRIDPAVVNNIGVKTAAVERGTLFRNVDTVGYVTPDADRVVHIHVRAEGWIETLEADTVGDAVTRDGLLFEIYSPALVSAQEEYLQAVRSGSTMLEQTSAQRLAALGLLPGQIAALTRSGITRQQFAVHSPQDGYVMDLNVREGMFVQPGTTIMSLADLSRIWVDVDVFEQQIGWVRPGQVAHMRLPVDPDRVWHGEVDYVYPTIRPESRTARVRLTFDNPDLALKPNMYARVEIDVAPRRDVLHVPSQAVIRSGRQERVIIALSGGRFRPAEVVTGLESGGRVEIVDGLSEGETVVISSQFLIDSEASLDASLLRMLETTPEEQMPGGDMQSGEMTHDHGGRDPS